MSFPRLQLLIAAFLAAAAMTVAQDKIAYLNMEKIFEGYYKTVNANISFEQRKQDFEDRLQLIRDELNSRISEVRKLEAEVKNDLLGAEAREEARRKLQQNFDRYTAIRDEHDRFRQSGMQELQRVRASTEEELVEDLLAVIKKFAADNGYTHVIEVTGKTFNRIPVFLVYPENADITSEILKIINIGHEEEYAQAKKRLEDIRNKGKSAPAPEEGVAPTEAQPNP
ncbi:MAG TPA: OmpH family outer membrane protein [Lentisphaeria bacterium]|nr:OmpH family outer membrane protein [Lentisphaeria bacterium]